MTAAPSVRHGGEPAALAPIARLEALCDPGSLTLLRAGVRSRRLGPRAVPGDGVVAGQGRVAGRPVVCYAQDGAYLGGSLGQLHADSIVKVHALAGRAGAPVVGFVESAGARLQEGLDGLAGYARIFRAQVALSGRVPQIVVVCGAAAGGAAYSPGLADFVVMTERARMFLTGPGVVRDVTGEDLTAQELGGPAVHHRSGVCHLLAQSDVDAARVVRDLLCHLPSRSGERPPDAPPCDPPGAAPDATVPADPRRVYDVRDVIAAVVDGGALLEWGARYARNVVCGFVRLGGAAAGVVANQPAYLGGVLCADSSEKAARFVATCDAFGLPLVVLVDCPGFLPGSRQERRAVIRHGAELVRAFARATVPRVTVVLRKAFGGAFIAMNSGDLGADLVFAWPGAELGVMGPQQAVGVLSRREIAAAADPRAARDRLAAAYGTEHLSARSAEADGHVDAVIEPAATRDRLLGALASLSASRP